jgi:hypothetical protein
VLSVVLLLWIVGIPAIAIVGASWAAVRRERAQALDVNRDVLAPVVPLRSPASPVGRAGRTRAQSG